MITLQQWLTALRSGEWKQHRNHLCNADQTAFCCLGVGAKLAGQDLFYGGDPRDVPSRRFLLDLPGEMWATTSANILTDPNMEIPINRGAVGGFNDIGYTFSQIADVVEARARELGWKPEPDPVAAAMAAAADRRIKLEGAE